jgi:hypothetical protein
MLLEQYFKEVTTAMTLVPKVPRKVQYLLQFSFPLVKELTQKRASELSSSGRPPIDKEFLFSWLLVRKIMSWDYRTVADMAGVSHPTLIRANTLFLAKKVYQKLFIHLVKTAYRNGLIKGTHVAIDSSFVTTFSKKEEQGSLGWNGFKESFGFKLHLLIDATSHFPIALLVGDGVTSDGQVALPLLKRARPWLKKVGYVLADKGYDDTDIVTYIFKKLHAKAGIPIRKKDKRSKTKKNRYGNYLNWKMKTSGRTLKHSILNRRSSIERVFSSLKRTYHLGHEEVRGIIAFTKQVYLSLICYMLKLFYIAKVRC